MRNYKKYWTVLIYQNIHKLVLCIGLALSGLPAMAQHPGFDELKTRFQEGAVFNALFSQSYYDSYTGETVVSNGEIWISERSYKIKSDDKELVVDRDVSRVYDKMRNRLIISDYLEEDDDFAPSRMINGADSTYTVTESKSGRSAAVVVLETDDDFALFTRVEIELGDGVIPISITAHDYSDNVTTTRFRNGKFLSNAEQWFVLKYPDNVEIIDTRY